MSETPMQWQVKNTQSIQYDIVSCTDIFNSKNNLLSGGKENSRRIIVIDSNIYKNFVWKINDYFKKKNITIKVIEFDSSERNKSIDTYSSILSELDTFGVNRRSEPIIAIGGGVLTDLVGFVASSYRRGVPYIKIPTTLMGYVDASIAIKTGINFESQKNRIGSFFAPQKVILDKTFLTTQSKRHIRNGVGEIAKLAVIKDFTLFEHLESHGESCIESKFQGKMGDLILNYAIDSMLNELQPNLFEENLERIVDFGHTFSPILEMHENSDLLHGEAVVIDIALSSILSFIRKTLSRKDLNRILDLLLHLNLMPSCGFLNKDLLWESLVERTYHRDGLQRVPLPKSIGQHIFVNDITVEELHQTCLFFTNWRGEKMMACIDCDQENYTTQEKLRIYK